MPSQSRFRALFRLVTIALVAFLGIQFVRPKLTNPPVTADLPAPPEVKRILKTSCYNCHSNETTLPWFDQIVPAYWMVVSDVKEGRKHLNFSEIGKLPPAQQKAALYESVSQIELGAMPLSAYKRVHPESVITPEQLAVLKRYLNPATPDKPPAAADRSAAGTQYENWIRAGALPREAPPAPNAIPLPVDYRNWKPVSSTERFDNHSLRVILGNDLAVKAIAEHRTNPWPDGAILAKVAWFQDPEETGLIRSGAFWQVEFMLRDTRKYTATRGWGWARWRGSDLKPYGKGAAFSDECIGCHAPVRSNDYVFTMPVKHLDGSLPFQPLQGKLITSWAEKQNSTMSTLCGNDPAVEYARTHSQHDYPAGSILALVTWNQQEDRGWFGAKVPAALKSVEFVMVGVTPDQRPSYSYQKYQGTPLKQVSLQTGASPNERAAYLLSQRAAVMP